MKASALVKELQNLIAIHGDQDMAVDDGWQLRQLSEVDAVEEDECFVIWMKKRED